MYNYLAINKFGVFIVVYLWYFVVTHTLICLDQQLYMFSELWGISDNSLAYSSTTSQVAKH
jgi:hypothetical protein